MASSLHHLIMTNQGPQAVSLLREAPELASYRTKGGEGALCIACKRNCVEVVKYLLAQGDATFNEPQGGATPLESAIYRGFTEIVDLLLRAGADPNIGRTIFAAYNSRSDKGVEILKRLIEHNVDVNRVFAMFGKRQNARSALDFCAERPEFVEVLKAAGARSAKEIIAANPLTPVMDAED